MSTMSNVIHWIFDIWRYLFRIWSSGYTVHITHLQNGLLAAEAGARVVPYETVGAHGLPVLYVEGGLRDRLIAVLAGEVLRVPGLAQGRDDALLYDLIALVTDWCRLRLGDNKAQSEKNKKNETLKWKSRRKGVWIFHNLFKWIAKWLWVNNWVSLWTMRMSSYVCLCVQKDCRIMPIFSCSALAS